MRLAKLHHTTHVSAGFGCYNSCADMDASSKVRPRCVYWMLSHNKCKTTGVKTLIVEVLVSTDFKLALILLITSDEFNTILQLVKRDLNIEKLFRYIVFLQFNLFQSQNLYFS